MAEQTELNKWKRCNVVFVCFSTGGALGDFFCGGYRTDGHENRHWSSLCWFSTIYTVVNS